MSNTIKLEIENTPQNALAASAFFALLSGDESAKALAAKAKTRTVGPKTEAPDPAPVVEQTQPETQTTEQAQEAPDANADGLPSTVDLSIGLDDDEMPWDSRIHSTGKKKLAKKPHTWKLIRGVDKDLVAKVQAELSAFDWPSIVNGGGSGAPANAEPEQASNTTDAAAAFGFPNQQPEAPAGDEPLDNQKFVQICMAAMGNGHQYNGQPLQQHTVLEVLKEHGIQNPTQIPANPAGARAALKQLGIVG